MHRLDRHCAVPAGRLDVRRPRAPGRRPAVRRNASGKEPLQPLSIRTRHLVANWKMNLPPEGIGPYLAAVGSASSGVVRVVVAPPYPYLKEISSQTPLAVSAQNCADHEKGAFTGEIAPAMVRDCGAHYVILGHSELRRLYGESDAMIARKLALAIAAGLTPVLCIGEELRTRDAGHVATFLAGQIRAAAEAGLDAAAA